MEKLKKTIINNLYSSNFHEALTNIKNLENDFKETTWTRVYKKYENTFKEAFDFYKDQFYDDSDTHVSKKVGNLFYVLANFKGEDPVWKLYPSNYNDM